MGTIFSGGFRQNIHYTVSSIASAPHAIRYTNWDFTGTSYLYGSLYSNATDGKYYSVRAVDGKTSGLWYIEFVCYTDSNGATVTGLSSDTSAASLLQHVGDTPNSIGIQYRVNSNSPVLLNGTQVGSVNTNNINSPIVHVAWDGTHTYWGAQGQWWIGDPVRRTGGIPYNGGGLPVRPMASIARSGSLWVTPTIGTNFSGTVNGTWGSLGPSFLPQGYSFWKAN